MNKTMLYLNISLNFSRTEITLQENEFCPHTMSCVYSVRVRGPKEHLASPSNEYNIRGSLALGERLGRLNIDKICLWRTLETTLIGFIS